MAKLTLTRESLVAALEKLHNTLGYLEKMRSLEGSSASIIMANEDLERSLRDSLIQRFEFCADLFWKYLKRYQEEELSMVPEANAPRFVIMNACKAKLISETDTEILLEMIKSRNFTSHIYKEELADQISKQIPEYYKIMYTYTEKLRPTL